ncbi:MAG: hypothetical protein HW421_3341 [Ignavibacteria bacterium]|nr:hypothetical protein [Ignavibacteria bacterium]
MEMLGLNKDASKVKANQSKGEFFILKSRIVRARQILDMLLAKAKNQKNAKGRVDNSLQEELRKAKSVYSSLMDMAGEKGIEITAKDFPTKDKHNQVREEFVVSLQKRPMATSQIEKDALRNEYKVVSSMGRDAVMLDNLQVEKKIKWDYYLVIKKVKVYGNANYIYDNYT